ncbi:unnamed protein product [Schistocephalus solidus]|uniref:Ubiquitin-like-conjugating enzyme ATG10 n=1 Tax=Schistocephalus solidus TaxID=70667 RepID=A0A0V0J519_SCHSO|nr:unnamed protein product [Schistocephalus solidus]
MSKGTLSLTEFNNALRELFDVLKTAKTSNSWRLETANLCNSSELVCLTDAVSVEPSPSACTIAKSLRIEYRVIYNDVYEVPVLLFRGFYADGSPVDLLYFWSLFNSKYQQAQKLAPDSSDAMWYTISQTEHQLTGVPFYSLHPCKTVEFMQTVLSEVSEISPFRYLTLWLSSVAQYFNFEIPPSVVSYKD